MRSNLKRTRLPTLSSLLREKTTICRLRLTKSKLRQEEMTRASNLNKTNSNLRLRLILLLRSQTNSQATRTSQAKSQRKSKLSTSQAKTKTLRKSLKTSQLMWTCRSNQMKTSPWNSQLLSKHLKSR